MKLSLWYVLREFRRRPKRFLSLTAVSAAVFSVLILMVLWMEAEWRADVMPERPENYHLAFLNLTEADKDYIRAQSWVQTTYDTWRDSDDPAQQNRFCVRVTWKHVPDALALARSVMMQRGLFEREPYASRYRLECKYQYDKFVEKWNGRTDDGVTTAKAAAELNARSYILRYQVQNRSFLRKTQNGYLMQPRFFTALLVFALFLGAATTILILESYRSSFSEYGCLRALGLRREQLFYVNLLEVLGVNLAAIPVSVLATAGAVRLYYAITAPYAARAGTIYFTITHYVPVKTLLLLAAYLILAALGGTLYVCFLYRGKSVMSLLRGEGTFAVSFVSKTSPRFERSRGVGGYARLYGIRARAALLRYTAVTALLLPLPMYYLGISAHLLSFFAAGKADADPASAVEGIYLLFQALSLFATTLCITFAASRISTQSRCRELAVFRALGADRAAVRRVTYPLATAQGASILALVLMLAVAIFSDGSYVASREGAKSLHEAAGTLLSFWISAAIFVIPSVYGGLSAVLHSFFRRPILASLRETDS